MASSPVPPSCDSLSQNVTGSEKRPNRARTRAVDVRVGTQLLSTTRGPERFSTGRQAQLEGFGKTPSQHAERRLF
jgi:hypothetical protein